MSSRGQGHSIVESRIVRLVIHEWENNYNCRGFLQGVRDPIPTSSPPNLGVLWWEDEPPKLLPLKASGIYFWECHQLEEYKDSTLKEHTENLTHSQNQGRSSNQEGVYIRPIMTLERPPKRQEAVGTQPGDVDTVAAVLGELILLQGH